MSRLFTIDRWRIKNSSITEETVIDPLVDPFAQYPDPLHSYSVTPQASLLAAATPAQTTQDVSSNQTPAYQPTPSSHSATLGTSAATDTTQPTNAPHSNLPAAVGSGTGHIEILVQFKAGAAAADTSAAIKGFGGTFIETVRAEGDDKGNLVSISVPEHTADAVIAGLSKNPNVSFAEMNWAVTAQAVSTDDTYYSNGSLWGMYGNTTSPANTYGSQAAKAWAANYSGSQSVIIGNIDTGIDYTHPDLYLNVWLNQKEIPFLIGTGGLKDVNNDGLITFYDLNDASNASFVTDKNGNRRIDAEDLLSDSRWANKIDEDRNGYIDDLIGWDFVNNDNNPYDDNNHGTHTSGTIGGLDNTEGVIGVAPNVQIMALKFLSGSGSGAISDAIKAEDYYTAAAKNQAGNFVATSNSWGGGGFSQGMLDSIINAAKADLLFVAAAGNGGSDGVGDNNDSVANYPSNYSTLSAAGYEAVIAVAALTSSGRLASFSNFGTTNVDLAAPGVGVWSTVAGGGYASYNGTSMATPHVSGALALLSAAFPNATANELRDALLSSVIKISGLSVGSGGTLDVENAIGTLKATMQPGISIRASSPSITEGDTGSQAVTFTISINSPDPITGDGITVNWNLNFMSGSTDSADFAAGATSGQVTLTEANKSRTVTINVAGDTTREANEQFKVVLSNPSSSTLVQSEAIVTIINNDDDYVATSSTNATIALNDTTATSGVVDSSGDLDAFKVNLTAGKTYQFDMKAFASSLDSYLYLRNPSFTQVASNDDIASGVTDSRIVYTPTTSGTYYLQAGGYSSSTGGYKLTAIGDATIDGTPGSDTLGGTALSDIIVGGSGADMLSGGASRDTFTFNLGDSPTTGFDRITDYTKSQDVIDLVSNNLFVGGAGGTATSSRASISQTTGIASFAKNSGTTFDDALNDIAQSFKDAGGTSAGEFALFRVNNTGSFYAFISDNLDGVTSNDVVVQLNGITSIRSISLTGGDLIIA